MRCNDCRYWSWMCARSCGCGPLEALCLSPDGTRRQKYTTGSESCPSVSSNHLGQIDEPDDDPCRYDDEAQQTTTGEDDQ